MILYVDNANELTKRLLGLIKEFNNVAAYQINSLKRAVFVFLIKIAMNN